MFMFIKLYWKSAELLAHTYVTSTNDVRLSLSIKLKTISNVPSTNEFDSVKLDLNVIVYRGVDFDFLTSREYEHRIKY